MTGVKVTALKTARVNFGGRTIDLVENRSYDLQDALAKSLIEKGLVAEEVLEIEEIPEMEEEPLRVLTSDRATEVGARKMRAKVIKVERTTGLRGTDQVHLILRPLDHEGWADQHEWYGLAQSKGSAFVEFCDQLVKLGAVGKEETLLKIQGRVFDWEEREGVGRSKGTKWWPTELHLS